MPFLVEKFVNITNEEDIKIYIGTIGKKSNEFNYELL